jgi:hypothetical protein
MFRVSSSAVFSRLNALVVASCLLASTCLAPLAHAQAPKKKPTAAASASAEATIGGDTEKSAEAAKPAPDKKTRAAARKAYADGEKAYGKGDYAAAYESFNKAIELIPSPHAEYWAAASLDKLDRANEAIAAYEQFLADPGASKVGDDKVSLAKSRLEAMKAKLVGEVSLVTTPAGASVSVDGEPESGATPLTVKLPPGAHKVSLTLAGHQPKEIEINVTTGEKTEQKVELASQQPETPVPAAVTPEPAPEPAEPPPPPEKRSKVPAFVTLGIAGAGAAVGAVFGVKALSKKKDYDDHPTTDAADDVERNALIADMAFGVAITLGVTGIVLLTSADSGSTGDSAARHVKPTQAKLNVAPYFGQHGGGAAARWAF